MAPGNQNNLFICDVCAPGYIPTIIPIGTVIPSGSSNPPTTVTSVSCNTCAVQYLTQTTPSVNRSTLSQTGTVTFTLVPQTIICNRCRAAYVTSLGNDGSTQCLTCNPQYADNITGDSVTYCDVCAVGYASTGTNKVDFVCDTCYPGYLQQPGTSGPTLLCLPCAPGYDPATGCTSCLANTNYAPTVVNGKPTNPIICTCKPGFAPTATATVPACTVCLPNYSAVVVNSKVSSCISCIAGFDISKQCTACLAGYLAIGTGAALTCKACIPGFDPAFSCTKCMPSTLQVISTGKPTVCICATNNVNNNKDPATSCTKCLNGFITSTTAAGVFTCPSCATGYTGVQCNICATGYRASTTNTGLSICTKI